MDSLSCFFAGTPEVGRSHPTHTPTHIFSDASSSRTTFTRVPPPPPFHTHPPSLQPSFERCQVSCLQRGSSSSFPLKRSVVQWWYTANIQHWVRVRSKQPPPLDRPKQVSCEQIPHLEIRREIYYYNEKNEAFWEVRVRGPPLFILKG